MQRRARLRHESLARAGILDSLKGMYVRKGGFVFKLPSLASLATLLLPKHSLNNGFSLVLV